MRKNSNNFSTIYQNEGGGTVNTIGNITVDELHEYVSLMASKIAKMTVEENSVVTGTITASAGNNYTIQLKTSDSQSNARPLTDGAVYNVGDYVYLIRGAAAIEGGESPSYFIFGRVDDTNEAFANASDLERFNGQDSYTLPSSSTSITFKKDSDEDVSIFWTRLKTYKALKIEGNFTTDDNVGVTVTYNYADGTEEEFKLDDAWMQGQPKNMDSLYQSRVIERTKEIADDDDIVTVTVTVVNGANVTLTAGTLNKYLKDFSLEVKPTNKSYFRNELPEDLEEDTVRLEAKLKYLDSGISSGVQYYWFVEMPEGITVADLSGDTTDKYTALPGITEFEEGVTYYMKNDQGGYVSIPNSVNSVEPEETYYIKISSAKNDKDQVNGVGGDRWYCLNDYNDCTVVGQTEKIRVWNKSDNFILLDKFKYLLDENIPNVFSFDSLNKIPFKFVNKIKCVAVYEGFYINSEVFELIDYSKEQYSVKLVPNEIEPHNIVSTTDFVEFTCEVTNDNPHSGGLTPVYNWYKVNSESKQEPDILIISSTDKPILRVHGGNPSDDEKVENYKVDNSSQIYFFYCKVEFKKDEVAQFSETTEKVKITSYLGNTLVFTEKYKYYISQNSGVIFNPTDDLKQTVWTILDDSVESESWTDIDNKEAIAVKFEVFNGKRTVNNDGSLARWHLYYTYQQITTVEGSDEIIDSTEWSRPIILRIVEYRNGSWTDIRSSTEVSQLNTFNELTNNGEDEGIYYTDVNEYIITSDTTAVKDKAYYLKEEYILADNSYFKLGFKDEITYYQIINNTFTVVEKNKGWVQGIVYYKENADNDKVKCGGEDFNRVDFLNSSIEYWTYTDGKYSQVIDTEEITETNPDPREFVPGTEYYVKGISYRDIVVEEGTSLATQTYYEKTDSKSHLYINATYINTGTLSVGQGANEKFYASIHNPEVRIAGFTVNENSISNNETGDKQLYFGKDGLQIGNAFNTTVDEVSGKASVTISGDITVTNGTGSDGTLSGVFSDLQKQISEVDANKIMIDTVTEYYVINNVSKLPEDPDEWKNDKENFNFTPDIQTPTNEQPYLWNYEVTTYTGKEEVDSTTPVIIAYYTEDGADGWSIDSITNWYAVSKTEQAPGYGRGGTQSNPTENWTQDPSQAVLSSTNPYLWNYEVITYSGGKGTKNPTITQPALIGSRGDDGNIEITQADTIAYYCEGSNEAPDQTPPKNPNNGNTGNWLIEASFFGGQGWFGKKEGKTTYVWKTLATQVDSQLIFSTSAVRLSDMEAVELAAKHWIVSTRYIKQNQDGTWKFPETVPSDIEGAISILDPLTGDANNNYKVPEGDIGRWCYLYDRTVISGGAIVTGSITADKLKVNSLEAVSGEMGRLTAGEIMGNDYGSYAQAWSNSTIKAKLDSPNISDLQETDIKYFNFSLINSGTAYSICWKPSLRNELPKRIVFPKSYNDLPVRQVANTTASNTVEEIYCLDNIQEVASSAGSIAGECPNLHTVNLYYSKITTLPYRCCCYNSHLSNLILPESSLKSIESQALLNNGSNGLTIIVPTSVTTIASNAFEYMTNMTNVNLLVYKSYPAISSATQYLYSDIESDTGWRIVLNSWKISTLGTNFIESNNFKVSHDGTIEAKNGMFTGTINAEDGIITLLSVNPEGQIQFFNQENSSEPNFILNSDGLYATGSLKLVGTAINESSTYDVQLILNSETEALTETVTYPGATYTSSPWDADGKQYFSVTISIPSNTQISFGVSYEYEYTVKLTVRSISGTIYTKTFLEKASFYPGHTSDTHTFDPKNVYSAFWTEYNLPSDGSSYTCYGGSCTFSISLGSESQSYTLSTKGELGTTTWKNPSFYVEEWNVEPEIEIELPSYTVTKKLNNLYVQGNIVPYEEDTSYSLGLFTRPWNNIYQKGAITGWCYLEGYDGAGRSLLFINGILSYWVEGYIGIENTEQYPVNGVIYPFIGRY